MGVVFRGEWAWQSEVEKPEVPCNFQNSVGGSTCADTGGKRNLAAFRLAEEVAAFPLADQDSDTVQVLGKGRAV